MQDNYLQQMKHVALWFVILSSMVFFTLALSRGTFAIENEYLDGAYIENDILRNVTVVNSEIVNSYIVDSNIQSSTVRDSTLDTVSLLQTTVENSVMKNVYFLLSLVTGSNFQNGTFENSTLSSSYGEDAAFRDGTLNAAELRRAAVLHSIVGDSTFFNTYLGDVLGQRFNSFSTTVERSSVKDAYIQSLAVRDSDLTNTKLVGGEIESVGLHNSEICDIWHDDVQAYFEECVVVNTN